MSGIRIAMHVGVRKPDEKSVCDTNHGRFISDALGTGSRKLGVQWNANLQGRKTQGGWSTLPVGVIVVRVFWNSLWSLSAVIPAKAGIQVRFRANPAEIRNHR